MYTMIILSMSSTCFLEQYLRNNYISVGNLSRNYTKALLVEDSRIMENYLNLKSTRENKDR